MIEFDEINHKYWVDGMQVPCVSDLLHFIFPNKYKDVPKEILERKAIYGSQVHKAVECLEQDLELPKLDYIQEESIEQYKKIKEENSIEVISQEQKVQYKSLYVGTYDMEAMIKGEHTLVDIKTTAELDKESLSWQLSFYELATGKTFEKLCCIWLPKANLGKLIEIKRKPKKDLLEAIEGYYNENI